MNWGELKAAVSEYLEAGSDQYTKNLGLFARLAEEDIYRQVQLPAVRETSWTNFEFGVPYLSLPNDFLSMYSVLVKAGGEYSHLLLKDSSYLAEAFPDPLEPGLPRFYAIFDEQNFSIAPCPDQAYEVQMDYFVKPISISNNDLDANTSWLSRNGENALLFGIVYHGYIFEKGDQDVAAMYKEQFGKGIMDLKTITEGRQKKDTNRTPDQRIPT